MKRYKVFTVLSLLIFATFMWSCARPDPKDAVSVDANTLDSLHQGFVERWNAQDVDGLSNSISKDVSFMTNTIPDKQLIRGREGVTRYWIRAGASGMKDLNTSTVSNKVSGELMFTSGTYQHYMMTPDSLMGPIKGQFTFILTDQGENDWKISHIHLQRIEPPVRPQRMNQKMKNPEGDR